MPAGPAPTTQTRITRIHAPTRQEGAAGDRESVLIYPSPCLPQHFYPATERTEKVVAPARALLFRHRQRLCRPALAQRWRTTHRTASRSLLQGGDGAARHHLPADCAFVAAGSSVEHSGVDVIGRAAAARAAVGGSAGAAMAQPRQPQRTQRRSADAHPAGRDSVSGGACARVVSAGDVCGVRPDRAPVGGEAGGAAGAPAGGAPARSRC
eukprot:ctg_336.g182